MKNLLSNQIREMWLKFFETKNHYIIPSESLVPINDESLLFINSGVATLKDYFSGKQTPPSLRMVNSQRAIRTGDIEIIGKTARHHTMFEMLGNFSIGDYFKDQAIEYAWEFLTSPQWLGLDKKKIYITVFEGNEKISFDKEAYKKWRSLGVKKSHIFKMGKSTNFWDMGIGPCGPSSEIFFDRGKIFSKFKAKKLIKEDLENDRYIEIWNIVFSEFNNDGKKNYTSLPQKNIDTGAGLERIASILQQTPTNFETDLFKPLIEKISTFTTKKYIYDYIPGTLLNQQEILQMRFKAIADFSRAIIFAISDGVVPSNTGRGYVVRRILRKALVYARSLEINQPFIYQLVDIVISMMGEFFPNLITNREIIIEKIKFEEESFFSTIHKGIKLFEKEISKIPETQIPTKIAFTFFETYGLPYELINEVAEQNGKTINQKEFNKSYEQFVSLSKQNAKQTIALEKQQNLFFELKPTEFVGYEVMESIGKILAIRHENGNTLVVTDKTPFYATSGGQEFDKGTLGHYKVINVTKDSGGIIVHHIEGEITDLLPNTEVLLKIDKVRRDLITKNHSAVHLMFAALEKVYRVSIPQVGSKVDQDFFRFDISLHQKPTEETLYQAQKFVNEWIEQKVDSEIFIMDQAKAKALGATFLDGTKYGQMVRVVKFGFIALDLCGGTHVKNTSEIEEVSILGLESKGSGIYRIIGVSGKDNVIRETKLINKKVLEQFKTEQFSKFNTFNTLLSKLELNQSKQKLEYEFSKFDSLDLTSNTFLFKKEVQNIKEELNKIIVLLTDEITLFLKNLIKQKDFISSIDIPNKILTNALNGVLNENDDKKNRLIAISFENIIVGIPNFKESLFLEKFESYLKFLNLETLFNKIQNKNGSLILICNTKNLTKDKLDLIIKFFKEN